MKPILIISFWNPNPKQPNQGIFIQEQVKEIFKYKKGNIFLKINILPHKNKYFKKVIVEEFFESNTFINLDLYSRLWKLLYYAPDFVYYIAKRIINKRYCDFKPVIVHSNVIFPCALVGHRFAKHFSADHVITEHWSQVAKILKNPIYGKRLINVYQKSIAIICVSKFLMNTVQAKTGNPNVYQIPNIIDTSIFKFDEPKNLDSSNIKFLCIAAWDKPKRLDLILDSLILFSKTTKFIIEVNVIGEGFQKDIYVLKEFPENIKVKFHGIITKQEIAALFKITTIFLHASDHETFSIVTAEALSTGTPVMVSNIDALPELVNTDNGILVENNLESWLNGLNKIIGIRYDHANIAAVVADKYTPEAIYTMIANIYKNISKKN